MSLKKCFQHSPDDPLRSGADGLEVLVPLEDGEARVADLDRVEVGVARRGRHGGRRVGHAAHQPLCGSRQTVRGVDKESASG